MAIILRRYERTYTDQEGFPYAGMRIGFLLNETIFSLAGGSPASVSPKWIFGVTDEDGILTWEDDGTVGVPLPVTNDPDVYTASGRAAWILVREDLGRTRNRYRIETVPGVDPGSLEASETPHLSAGSDDYRIWDLEGDDEIYAYRDAQFGYVHLIDIATPGDYGAFKATGGGRIYDIVPVPTQAAVTLMDADPGSARLGADAKALDTAIELRTAPDTIISKGAWVVLGRFTTECELRRITAIAGAVINFAEPLLYDHDNGEAVLLLPAEVRHLNWWGADPTGATNSTTAIVRAILAANGSRVDADFGTYLWDGYDFDTTTVNVRGRGRLQTTFKHVTGASMDQFRGKGPGNIFLRDLNCDGAAYEDGGLNQTPGSGTSEEAVVNTNRWSAVRFDGEDGGTCSIVNCDFHNCVATSIMADNMNGLLEIRNVRSFDLADGVGAASPTPANNSYPNSTNHIYVKTGRGHLEFDNIFIQQTTIPTEFSQVCPGGIQLAGAPDVVFGDVGMSMNISNIRIEGCGTIYPTIGAFTIYFMGYGVNISNMVIKRYTGSAIQIECCNGLNLSNIYVADSAYDEGDDIRVGVILKGDHAGISNAPFADTLIRNLVIRHHKTGAAMNFTGTLAEGTAGLKTYRRINASGINIYNCRGGIQLDGVGDSTFSDLQIVGNFEDADSAYSAVWFNRCDGDIALNNPIIQDNGLYGVYAAVQVNTLRLSINGGVFDTNGSSNPAAYHHIRVTDVDDLSIRGVDFKGTTPCLTVDDDGVNHTNVFLRDNWADPASANVSTPNGDKPTISSTGTLSSKGNSWDAIATTANIGTPSPLIIPAQESSAAQTVLVTGARLGDDVAVRFLENPQGVRPAAQVTATDTVRIEFRNPTGSQVTLDNSPISLEVTHP